MRRALDIVRRPASTEFSSDEPTIGLDLPNRRRIWRFIDRLRVHTAMTVLLTTHYLEEADSCDRVSFIRKGRMVESGTPRALVEHLGKHIVEVESSDIERLATQLEPRLGPCLRDGDTAMFRWEREDIGDLTRFQSAFASAIGSWKVRRRNNDVSSVAGEGAEVMSSTFLRGG